MTNTKPNVIQEFFIPIKKIRQKSEDLIPELVYTPPPSPPTAPHPNIKVAEWIADVKKRERK